MFKFKRKYTKWIPFGNYTYDTDEYIVFVRKNLNTGMMNFKVKSVSKSGFLFGTGASKFVPDGLIDVKKAWETIVNL